MKRIKIIYGDGREALQNAIDKWIEEKNPEIINCSMSVDDKANRYIAVVYEDNVVKL